MKQEIDKDSKIPLYIQLANIFIENIEKNMNENDKLDTEREISKKYSLSRVTVRQSLDYLQKNGYIYKIHGKGNFVAERTMEQNLTKFYSFSEDMIKRGKIPTTEIVTFEILEIDKKIASKLKLKENDLVYKIARIRSADAVPMIYEISYIPYSRFKDLNKKMLEYSSMYDVFNKNYHTQITYAEEFFRPVLVNKIESIYLNIKEGDCALKVERYTYENQQIIEYTVSITRGDKFKYRVCLINDLNNIEEENKDAN